MQFLGEVDAWLGDWRWMVYINLMLGLVAAPFAWFDLRRRSNTPRDAERPVVLYVFILLFGLATLPIVLAISRSYAAARKTRATG